MAGTSAEPLGSEHLLPYERGEQTDPHAELVDLVDASDELSAIGETEDEDDALEIEVSDDEAETEDDDADDSDDDGEDEDDADDDQPRYKVKANGEEIEVPLDELIRGYSRQADYTRKTSELARTRQAIELQRAQSAERLQMMARVADRLSPQDREIMAAEWEADAVERASLAAEARREYVAGQAELLVQAIPEWQEEPERATAEKRAIGEYALSIGIPAEVVREIADHTVITTLRKAWLYDQMQTKGKAAIRGKVTTAQVLKPGGRVSHEGGRKRTSKTAIERAMRQLDKSGRPEDAAALFAHLFDE